MVHHWKGLEFEITDFEFHHYPTPSGETIPSKKSSNMVYVNEMFLIIMMYFILLKKS